jgi:hypothetical protein
MKTIKEVCPLCRVRASASGCILHDMAPELLAALKEAGKELLRIYDNQADMDEEDLTDIARPDEILIESIFAAIRKSEGR